MSSVVEKPSQECAILNYCTLVSGQLQAQSAGPPGLGISGYSGERQCLPVSSTHLPLGLGHRQLGVCCQLRARFPPSLCRPSCLRSSTDICATLRTDPLSPLPPPILRPPKFFEGGGCFVGEESWRFAAQEFSQFFLQRVDSLFEAGCAPELLCRQGSNVHACFLVTPAVSARDTAIPDLVTAFAIRGGSVASSMEMSSRMGPAYSFKSEID